MNSNDIKNKFCDFFRNRLSNEKPAFEAHKKMVPRVDNLPYKSLVPKNGAKKSAVLLPIYFDETKNDFNFILTLRSENLNSHKGQISFPGGRAENGENSIETALREANEEIGLKYKDAKILGPLSDLYVPPSNSIISPVIAFLDKYPKMQVNPSEVDTVFTESIDYLNDDSNIIREDWEIFDQTVLVPNWKVSIETRLWGATAMIISEFLFLYNEFKTNI